MRLQRLVQAASLALFLLLLWQTVFPLGGWLVRLLPGQSFLLLDPLIAVGTDLAARTWLPDVWPAFALLLAGLVAGRLFCGYLCPLGASIDCMDRVLGARQDSQTLNARSKATLRTSKYLVLLVILGAALCGVSLVFLASPISLITRLYGLFLFSVVERAAAAGLDATRPVFEALDMKSVYFLQLIPRRYAAQLFVVLFFALLFGSALFSPRFWCRYLCPAGALFALFSRSPLIRRRVSDDCIQCGRCQKHCPMDAIGADAKQTDHTQCLACELCVALCPADAVSFGWSRVRKEQPAGSLENGSGRRAFLAATAGGAGVAMAALVDLRSPYAGEAEGRVADRSLIRPPGAVPEADFLARCVRCGLCMRACPTNTLQPVWLASGFSGLFSPGLAPMRGPCEPLCNACGQVCPSGALRPLPLAEKKWSKLGTAVVLRSKCLAWERQRACLVCDEVCPYDAVELREEPGNAVRVPYVRMERCTGCGFCQWQCPVRPHRAIEVEPLGALRLASGSYELAGRTRGLDIALGKERAQRAELPGAQDLSQGHQETKTVEDAAGDLPPGFSLPE